MQTVLTIAGFDPSSGAGVTADLMTFAAHGLFGTSAITSLTVQSTLGVESSHPVDANLLAATLRCLDADLPPAGIKIGMLATAAIVEQVSLYIETLRQRSPRIPIVLDPVLCSSSGRALLDQQGTDLLQSRLLPLVDWITPNLDELSLLTGQPVQDEAQMLTAATLLQRPGLHILAKGGHLPSTTDLLLTPGAPPHWLPGTRINTTSTHGTGCTLSSALLSRLLLGDSAVEAAKSAKAYVTEALRTATKIGRGRGPMNHLWPIRALKGTSKTS
jgi:hydroxymethylpyrimidine/phosphomethylpyrimidine kinase